MDNNIAYTLGIIFGIVITWTNIWIMKKIFNKKEV